VGENSKVKIQNSKILLFEKYKVRTKMYMPNWVLFNSEKLLNFSLIIVN